MNNTVLLSGKGWGAHIFFLALLDNYPDARITQPKLKWWQSTYRYEMRLQNLPREDIDALMHLAVQGYPLTTLIKVEVF